MEGELHAVCETLEKPFNLEEPDVWNGETLIMAVSRDCVKNKCIDTDERL